MTLHTGDCLDVMAGMEPDSIDAIVTDPPYLLRFMGKTWDSPTSMSGHRDETVPEVGRGTGHDHGLDNWNPKLMGRWHEQWATAALRVAKPGAYLLAFGGTRTVHRMTCALEDAGWVIRDMLVWAYASGFPKSRALLKPAWEPIVMARKPGPLRELDIDGCRIGWASDDERAEVNARTGPNSRHRPQKGQGTTGPMSALGERHVEDVTHHRGRWPANIVLTDPVFDGGWEGVVGGGETGPSRGGFTLGSTGTMGSRTGVYGAAAGEQDDRDMTGYGDTGTYSRFFLIPKASRSDREPVLRPEWAEAGKRASIHPTVKPIELMRHLVRLVCPPDGTCLDPFAGSGSTLLAADQEGRRWVGIEREAEYVRIIEARLAGNQQGMGLSA